MQPKSLDESRLSFNTIEMDLILKDSDLRAMARSLTLSSFSGMNRALNYYQILLQERSVNARGLFAFYDEKPIGWVLLTYEMDDMYFRPQPGHACVQVYVHPEYRRNGVGSKLVRMAEQIKAADTILNIYAGDEPEFFAPFVQSTSFKSIY